MSRFYRMDLQLQIPSNLKEKMDEIMEEAKKVWPFEFYYDSYDSSSGLTTVLATGNGNLTAGRSEQDFVEDLALRIWRKTGQYVSIIINAICLDHVPETEYEMKMQDFERMNELGLLTVGASASEDED